jgi:aryl sulfotransferase
MMLHFADLKADMPGQIRRIAEFLEIPIREESWEQILRHCSFDYMKQHATKSTPLGGAFWDEGAKVFVNKGVNGRWTGLLTADDVERYRRTAVAELDEECARWLELGG